MLDWLSLLVGVLSVALRSRRELILENPLLRHQLAGALRPRRRPALRRRDRWLWLLAQRVCAEWRRHLILVRPETVIRWHRQGWQRFWRWRSRRPTGRPRVPPAGRALIARMSRGNPLWGTERSRGERCTLGIAGSAGSIRRSRWRGPARPPSQTRRTFLRDHAAQSWAADLFTVPTLTFRTLFVLCFITHDRRELLHVRVTAHPTAAWVWRQLIEARSRGRQPRYVLRDRDAVSGRDVAKKAQTVGIDSLLTSFRSPRATAIAEWVIRTLRQACLDHVVALNERHLQAPLQEDTDDSNAERPHRSLALAPPLAPPRAPSALPGRVVARPVLGGLHHVYSRAA